MSAAKTVPAPQRPDADIKLSLKLDYQVTVGDLAAELICGLTSGQLVWVVTEIASRLDTEQRAEILMAIRGKD